HQFTAAEAELEAEMLSVVQEAERLQQGWGNGIFQAASEMVNNTRLRELREEMTRLNFEAANCQRSIMMEEMGEEERQKALTQGTPENEKLVKNDVLLSSIFNLPIGEAMNAAAAAHARKVKAEEEDEAAKKVAGEAEAEESPKEAEAPATEA
ncbi:hypothetical protein EC988_005841, partial [Linderina pennispora]